jgi:O-antigen/teichoic acid export membrane protein
VYLDRFLIGSLQSVEAAGIYFFYFSIVNAAYVVCLSATVQVYQPQLRAAYQQGGLRQLKVALRPRFRATALAGFGALLATLPVTWAAAHFSGKAAIIAAFPIVPLLIAAYAIKLLSDFMSVALAAAEQDGHYASFNILGLALSAGGCLLAVPLFGLAGAALAALATSGILVALRFLSWRRLEARLPVQEVLA